LSFGFEERLQSVLAASPHLLSTPTFSGRRLLLGREVAVEPDVSGSGPEAERIVESRARTGKGRMDVVFAESDGMPTLVEAKLYSNQTMDSVIDQALGSAEAMFAAPNRTAWELHRVDKRRPVALPHF
jgi:hypothetical protein